MEELDRGAECNQRIRLEKIAYWQGQANGAGSGIALLGAYDDTLVRTGGLDLWKAIGAAELIEVGVVALETAGLCAVALGGIATGAFVVGGVVLIAAGGVELWKSTGDLASRLDGGEAQLSDSPLKDWGQDIVKDKAVEHVGAFVRAAPGKLRFSASSLLPGPTQIASMKASLANQKDRAQREVDRLTNLPESCHPMIHDGPRGGHGDARSNPSGGSKAAPPSRTGNGSGHGTSDSSGYRGPSTSSRPKSSDSRKGDRERGKPQHNQKKQSKEKFHPGYDRWPGGTPSAASQGKTDSNKGGNKGGGKGVDGGKK